MTVTTNTNDVVIIPDAQLNICLHDALGISMDSQITTDNLASLTAIYAASSKIISLDGMEYCTNLQVVDLSGNGISDITALSNSVKIMDINIHANYISDLSPLGNLLDLVNLKIDNNKVTDLSPAAKFG
jgi:internalin A